MNKVIYLSGGAINSTSRHPSVRRRVARYAQRHQFELLDYPDDGQVTDAAVVVLQSADLTFWKRYGNRRLKIIFDANDPYILDQSTSIKRMFRGLFKYLVGSHKHFEHDYSKTILGMCQRADSVIVGHRNVYDMLKTYNIEAVHIPDYSVDISIHKKERYSLSKNNEVNIFWEGLGSSYIPFEDINRIFKSETECNYIFHFVTDLEFYSISDKYNKKYVFKEAKIKAPDMYHRFRFYQWSEFSFYNIGASCDFAIIPLPLNNGMNSIKPENKLIQLWRMGLPVITSSIPSYVSAFKGAGLNDFCSNDLEWRLKIKEFSTNDDIRAKNGTEGYNYVSKYYSDQYIDTLWNKVL